MRRILTLSFALMMSGAALAGQTEADTALTSILFEADMENVSYSLRSDGFVDITFGAAVSDADYSRILAKLQNHPDIPGVLAGRGSSNYCPIK